MKKNETIQILQNGFCELWYTDEHSVEHSIIATLSPTHLPEEERYSHHKAWQGNIHVFNVNTEKWETISEDSIIDIEQLTGVGAVNNENKLQAGIEYLEQLELFNTEDLFTDEHPDDGDGHTWASTQEA